MARLRYALDYISEVLMWLAYGACVLMMLHVALDVLLRSLKISLYGTTEIVSAYYMIIIAFLPWAWVTRYNQHIAADVFTELMPPRMRAWVAVFAHTLTIVFVALFTYQTYFAAVKQTRGNEILARRYLLSSGLAVALAIADRRRADGPASFVSALHAARRSAAAPARRRMMSPLAISLISIGVMLVLIGCQLPIGVALGGVAFRALVFAQLQCRAQRALRHAVRVRRELGSFARSRCSC